MQVADAEEEESEIKEEEEEEKCDGRAQCAN